jgi:hypothetical protein
MQLRSIQMQSMIADRRRGQREPPVLMVELIAAGDEAAGDDLRLDLGGALEDVEDAGVAQDPADRIFEGVAGIMEATCRLGSEEGLKQFALNWDRDADAVVAHSDLDFVAAIMRRQPSAAGDRPHPPSRGCSVPA